MTNPYPSQEKPLKRVKLLMHGKSGVSHLTFHRVLTPYEAALIIQLIASFQSQK